VPHQIVFEDYSADELFTIAKTMFEEEKFVLSDKGNFSPLLLGHSLFFSFFFFI
jgi:hypothetical protein